MGNKKANSYWEAELPPGYNRAQIENFVCAKYQEKKWIPREGRVSPKMTETKSCIDKSVPNNSIRHEHQGNRQHALEQRSNCRLPCAKSRVISESKTPVHSILNQQVTPEPKQHEAVEKPILSSKTAEKPIPAPTSSSPKPMKQQKATSAPVAMPPKLIMPLSFSICWA